MPMCKQHVEAASKSAPLRISVGSEPAVTLEIDPRLIVEVCSHTTHKVGQPSKTLSLVVVRPSETS